LYENKLNIFGLFNNIRHLSTSGKRNGDLIQEYIHKNQRKTRRYNRGWGIRDVVNSLTQPHTVGPGH